MPDGSLLLEPASPSETVASLRRRLGLGSRTRLRLGPHTLADNRTLQKSSVRRQSTLVVHDEAERIGDVVLYCRPRPTPPALAPNVVYAHEFSLDNTVGQVAAHVGAQFGGGEWARVVLHHNGRALAPDTLTLRDAGITTSAAIVVYRIADARASSSPLPPSAALAPVAPLFDDEAVVHAALAATMAVDEAPNSLAATGGVTSLARDAALHDAEKQVIELLTQVAMLTPAEIQQLAPEFQQQVLDIRRQLNIQPLGVPDGGGASSDVSSASVAVAAVNVAASANADE